MPFTGLAWPAAQSIPMQAVVPDAGKSMRLFFALWPGDALRRRLASWQQGWAWPPHVALVKPERLHLTLHFLGDVSADRLPDLAGLKSPFESFELAFGQAEVWPHGIAVLRPDNTPPGLSRLHASLSRELTELGLTTETRPYKPHVTLARRAYAAKPPQETPGLRWRIGDGYVLVRSLPGGAGYQVLERFN